MKLDIRRALLLHLTCHSNPSVFMTRPRMARDRDTPDQRDRSLPVPSEARYMGRNDSQENVWWRKRQRKLKAKDKQTKVSQKKEGRTPKAFWNTEAETKRKREQPRRKWLESVKKDLNYCKYQTGKHQHKQWKIITAALDL